VVQSPRGCARRRKPRWLAGGQGYRSAFEVTGRVDRRIKSRVRFGDASLITFPEVRVSLANLIRRGGARRASASV